VWYVAPYMTFRVGHDVAYTAACWIRKCEIPLLHVQDPISSQMTYSYHAHDVRQSIYYLMTHATVDMHACSRRMHVKVLRHSVAGRLPLGICFQWQTSSHLQPVANSIV
jgi:hypothetical protein